MTTTVIIDPDSPPLTPGELKTQLCRIRQSFHRPLPKQQA